VALLDLDIRKPSMYKIFDCRTQVGQEFNDVLTQKIAPKDYQFVPYKKTNLLLALNRKRRTDGAQWLGLEVVARYIRSISEKMDFVIIDTPPAAASADAASIIGICDRTILVVRTDLVGVADINDTILTVSNVGGTLAGCILNDLHRPFTLFGQLGLDETGSYGPRGGYYRYYASPSTFEEETEGEIQ
jgi:Mrp family chromosome partitioning ATPase